MSKTVQTGRKGSGARAFWLVCLAIVAVLAGILWLLLKSLEPASPAEGGLVVVRSGEEQVVPLSNAIYAYHRGAAADFTRLSPQKVFDDAPIIAYGPDFQVVVSGRKRSGPSYEVYAAGEERPLFYGESLDVPSEPGTYLVYFEVAWGDEDDFEGYQYFFRLLVE